MSRGEISWKRRDDEGHRCQVYAHRKGKSWEFFTREKRFDQWQLLGKPSLEDWLLLLDGIKRRIPRRLIPVGEDEHVRRRIRLLFPDSTIDS